METKIITKFCGRCGKAHHQIPANAKLQNVGDKLDGYYWECDGIFEGKPCNSTMTVFLRNLERMRNIHE